MFQKTLLILAIAAASTTLHAQSTPAKKELVARILKVQQPGMDMLVRGLVEQPALEMMDRAGQALPARIPAERREAVAKDIQADAKKYVDETMPIVRDRAIKLAPTTIGALLEEKFTEDELKQVATMLESPIYAKYQTLGGDMQQALVSKLLHHAVAEMGMYRKTRLNFGALNDAGARTVDDETRSIMESQSERLYGETKALLGRLKPLTEHLAGKLMDAGEMSLKEALFEIRSFEAACFSFDAKVGLTGAPAQQPAPDAA
ncbi:MAG: AAA-metalloprotease-like protein [Ramlibacter sp.]|nr:AAA-metalloprotease-like protein [Ramlibacter sp.]